MPNISVSNPPYAVEGGLVTGSRSRRKADRYVTSLSSLPALVTLNPGGAGLPQPSARGSWRTCTAAPAPHHPIAPAPGARSSPASGSGQGKSVFISQNNSLLLAEPSCCREPSRGRPYCPQGGRDSHGGRCQELTVLPHTLSDSNMSPKEKVMFCKCRRRSVITGRAAATYPTSCYCQLSKGRKVSFTC